MTQLMRDIAVCCICGNEVEYEHLMSTNSFGSMDLDMRKPGMIRYTMDSWSTECKVCGYVNEDIEETLDIGKDSILEIINSNNYKTCDGLNLPDNTSEKFYKQYLLHKESKDKYIQFKYLQKCAWTCDDCGEENTAKTIRRLAILYLEEDLKSVKDDNERETNQLLLIDFYRRTDQFDKVIQCVKQNRFSTDLLQKIAKYQVVLAEKKDDKCHRVNEAINDLFQ